MSGPVPSGSFEPRQRRGWPTLLHQLVSEETDDEWSGVMARIRSHPEEVAVQGELLRWISLRSDFVSWVSHE